MFIHMNICSYVSMVCIIKVYKKRCNPREKPLFDCILMLTYFILTYFILIDFILTYFFFSVTVASLARAELRLVVIIAATSPFGAVTTGTSLIHAVSPTV